LLLSLALGEREGKATAIAFKPAVKPDQEGSRLWIGTSYGNVHEVDIMRQRVVSSGLYPHTGRVVMSIHRFQNSMWTLDDDGTLQVWPPNSNGMPMLENRPITRKLPRGHSFSMVIRGILWVAVGREIQILRPSANDLGEFKITQQPYNQTGVGEITSGAVISDQLDKVYFGHSDGKITTYSIADYVCLGVVNASVYKINCLVGAGMHLWAGYNTGNICVYDVKSRPWKIIKEWHAHEGPVVNLSVDQSGLWISGRLRVGSVSLDNTIRIWDGLLEEDWLGASSPASLRYDEQQPNLLRMLLPPGMAPDLLIFGFQELVDLEDKRLTASLLFNPQSAKPVAADIWLTLLETLIKGAKRKDTNEQDRMSRQFKDWRDHLVRSIEDYMPTNESYTLLHTASMVGLFSCVFVRDPYRLSISNMQAAEIKRGMGGLHGNKVSAGTL
ncbi:MAG: hypothetical protein L6R35_005900, partial [Caloplaca aegaea]